MISINKSNLYKSPGGPRKISRRSEEMSSLLIENGARINHVNSHMQTALDHLQENLENSELVEYMKKQGVILVKICLKGMFRGMCPVYIFTFGGVMALIFWAKGGCSIIVMFTYTVITPILYCLRQRSNLQVL